MYYEKIQYPPPRNFSWSGDMKRAIAIEVLLLFTLGALIALSAFCFYVTIIDIKLFWDVVYIYLSFAILATLATVADIIAIVLIAFKEFPVFKPLVDKYKARKQAKAEAAAIKAETARRARIEQLQAELDELKKDE